MGTLKGFKGKGEAIQWEAELTQEYERTVAMMEYVSEMSKSLFGQDYFLQIHRKVDRGAVSLRWRGFYRVGATHLLWGTVTDLIKEFPDEVRAAYRELQEAAVFFNTKERALRKSVTEAKKAVRILLSENLEITE